MQAERGLTMATCKVERVHTRTYQERIAFEKQLISRFVNEGSRVVDAGYGHGNKVIDKSEVWEIVGVDSDATAIAGNKSISKGAVADMKELCLESCTPPFDMVVCFDVLEHLKDPKRFVSSAARLLKRGGHLFLAAPNRRCIAGFLTSSLPIQWIKVLSRVITGKETPNDTYYYRLNPVGKIKRCLDSEGFSKINIVLFNPILGKKWTLRRFAYRLDYWIGRASLVRDHSIRILCVAECVTDVSSGGILKE